MTALLLLEILPNGTEFLIINDNAKSHGCRSITAAAKNLLDPSSSHHFPATAATESGLPTHPATTTTSSSSCRHSRWENTPPSPRGTTRKQSHNTDKAPRHISRNHSASSESTIMPATTSKVPTTETETKIQRTTTRKKGYSRWESVPMENKRRSESPPHCPTHIEDASPIVVPQPSIIKVLC